MLHYDNWQPLTPSDLAFEHETEWDKMRYFLNTTFFDQKENFVSLVSQHGRIVRLTRHGDQQVNRRTHCASIAELEDMVSTYRSAARRKGVPTQLAHMMRAGEPLPTPLLMKRGNEIYVVGGNTRLDVAEILQITPDPKVTFVDLDALDLELEPVNGLFNPHSKAA